MKRYNGWAICDGSGKRPRAIGTVSWGIVGTCPDCNRVIEVHSGAERVFVEHINPNIPVKR